MPFQFHPDGLGGAEHAALLAGEVQFFQEKAHPGVLGEAPRVPQVVMGHIHIGGIHVNGDGVLHVAVVDDLALVQHDAAGAQLADGAHVVADIEHCAALLAGHVAHFAQALLLEFHVAHREDLVHDHDLGVEMGGHREGQLDEHAAGVALDRSVDEIAAFGEFNDLIQLGIHLGPGHAQDGAIHIDVFAAGHLVVEAGAHLQHAGNAALEPDFALRGGGDAAEQL